MKRRFSGVAKGLFGVTLALQSLYPVYDASATAASAQDVHEIADMCMYSQRILKDYALVGMGVTYHNSAKDLKTSAMTIDKYIVDLESHHLKKPLIMKSVNLKACGRKLSPSY